MTLPILGIDVGKKTLHLALCYNGKLLRKTCDNSPVGHQDLLRWLKGRKVEPVHACLEATGGFEEEVARALVEAGHAVSILNPQIAKRFAQSLNARNKTDKIDAEALALYGERNRDDLTLWTPPSEAVRYLRGLMRRRETLIENRTQELNRLEAPSLTATIRASIEDHLHYLDAEIARLEKEIDDHTNRHDGLKAQRDLLTSIPGVGSLTANWFLAEVSGLFEVFDNAKQLAAYCGISLSHRESGSSVRGKPKMCKFGNAAMRKALFMPAKTALWCNPVVKALGKRLEKKGKPYKLRVGAAMRKLLYLMYGVLRHRTPFDPSYQLHPA